ncbi:unnamed protein product, partial [Ectocarpus sp. 12 AP-2014]
MRRNKFESATAGALVLPISLPVFNLQEPLSPGPNDLLPFLAWIVREEVWSVEGCKKGGIGQESRAWSSVGEPAIDPRSVELVEREE